MVTQRSFLRGARWTRWVSVPLAVGLVLLALAAPASAAGEDTEAPTTPGPLVVTDLTATSVTLTWAASTDNVGVVDYWVTRYQVGGMPVIAVLPAPVAQPTLTFSYLTPGATYTFSVAARDAAGNASTSSAPLVVVTPTLDQGQCAVTYVIVSQWQGGFQAVVSIRCDGQVAVSGWRLAWVFPSGQRIVQIWNASVSTDGDAVTVADGTWNSEIPVGGSVSFGFIGTWTVANAVPTAFALNGVPCRVG